MAKKGKLVSWLEYIPARFVLDLLALLPCGVAVWAGIRIARVAYRLAGGLRNTGASNLRAAFPELSDGERSRILKASFDNLGRVLGDVSRFSRITPKEIEQLVDIDSEAYAWQIYEQSRGGTKTRNTCDDRASRQLGNARIFICGNSRADELSRPSA